MAFPADSETVRAAERRERLDGREIRAQAQKACAIAHGRGSGMSSNELWLIVLEDGLPSREERERILREKLAADAGGDNTTQD